MSVYFSKLGEYGKMGNAMFQAACTIALAKRNNDSFLFPSTWKYRNSFNLPKNCFTANIRPALTFNEAGFHYSPIVYRNNLDLLGYFQSEKYFKDFEGDIRTFFTPTSNTPSKPGVASIHVRRTDYLKFPNHHPTLDMKYYEKAMEKVGVNKFLVFSDDIPWCKQHFVGNQFEFSENHNEITDLALQMKCEHNIIANSTYSWWAAWLNDNKEKKVVCPEKWFGPALSMHNIKDLFPNGWIKI